MVTGTGIAIAQTIPIVITPILTRLYSPAQFGVFATFVALAGILAVVATGRYEVAIMMPKSNRRAQAVLLLALLINLASMAALLAVFIVVRILMSRGILPAFSLFGELGILLMAVPVFAFLNAALQSLTLWNSRQKAFRRVAASRFVQAATTAFVSIAAIGFSGVGGNGLILGALTGSVAGIFMLLPSLAGLPTSIWNVARFRLLAHEARTYVNYPKFSLLADLTNALAWRLPILVFPVLFGMATTGQLSIAYRIVGLPSQMIGKAFLDVFRQKAAEDFSRDGNCLAIYMKTLRILMGISVVLFLPLILFGGPLFSLVFGAEWRTAGEFVELLSAMFAASFVASPLAFVLYIANRQSWDLAWQILFAASTAIALSLGAWTASAEIAVSSLAALGLVSYLIYFGISYRTAAHGARASDAGDDRLL